MRMFVRTWILALVPLAPAWCGADTPDCFTEEVEAHVLGQFRIHGPLSTDREYFGFVYRYAGRIASASTHGGRCRSGGSCEVNSTRAAEQIPKGAKVLGEWHTHPHEFSAESLSPADVRGANDNRRIQCYRAFYSTSQGDIFTWDVRAYAVTAAMRSKRSLGNYREFHAATPLEQFAPPANVIARR